LDRDDKKLLAKLKELIELTEKIIEGPEDRWNAEYKQTVIDVEEDLSKAKRKLIRWEVK